MDTPTNTPTTPDGMTDAVTVTAAIIDITIRARAIAEDYMYAIHDEYPEMLSNIIDMTDALAGHYGIWGNPDNRASNPRDDAAAIVLRLRTLADALIKTGIDIRCAIGKAEPPALAARIAAE